MNLHNLAKVFEKTREQFLFEMINDKVIESFCLTFLYDSGIFNDDYNSKSFNPSIYGVNTNIDIQYNDNGGVYVKIELLNEDFNINLSIQ